MKIKKNSRKGYPKKENFFKYNIEKSCGYIKESKKFIFSVIILFILSLIAGFIFQPNEIKEFILEYIENVLKQTEGKSSFGMVIFIFLNNLQVAFMGILYGIVLGIFPILATIVNGYVVGYVSSYAISISGPATLLNLIPHGIFELPAIFISFGLGVKLGSFVFYPDKIHTLSRFLKESFRTFIFIIVPLLIVAAIIEGSLINILI